MEHRLRGLYRRLIRARFFSGAVVAGFFVYAVATAVVLAMVVVSAGVSLRQGAVSVRLDTGFSVLADVLIVLGALSWRRSRLSGLHWFKRSILVTILLAQPFLFYREQLTALLWLALDVAILEALNYMIGEERLLATAAARGGEAAGGQERQGATGATSTLVVD